MEVVIAISFILCITSFFYWIFDDDSHIVPFAVGSISFVIYKNSQKEPQHKEEHSFTTIEQIEYAVNKCSSFGGLKALHTDVIICMDETQIKKRYF